MAEYLNQTGLSYDDVLLVPQYSELESRQDADPTIQLLPGICLRVPVISANTDTVTESEMGIAMARSGGLGIIHRFMSIEDEVAAVEAVKQYTSQGGDSTTDDQGRLAVGAAIGVNDDVIERTTALVNAGADVIDIDIAHGHSRHALAAVRTIKGLGSNVLVIAGNVATAAGAEDLINAGADAIKVGIGPGSVCKTRLVTGCGVPQLTALREAYKVAGERHIPVIADGGIKHSGDIVKALAAGASAVMVAYLLQGTEESASILFYNNYQPHKRSRGVATVGAKNARLIERGIGIGRNASHYVAEGNESVVPFQGPVSMVLGQLLGGIQSGMSYCGARTIEELREKSVFMMVTGLSQQESNPRVVAN